MTDLKIVILFPTLALNSSMRTKAESKCYWADVRLCESHYVSLSRDRSMYKTYEDRPRRMSQKLG